VCCFSPLWLYAQLAATHVIVSDVAVATEPRGAVALASERRPDEMGDVELIRATPRRRQALVAILRVQHFGAGGRWQMARTPGLAPPCLLEGDAALRWSPLKRRHHGRRRSRSRRAGHRGD
jgi:hypothetical protein